MNNIIEERKRLVIEATRGKLMEETVDDFISLTHKVEGKFYSEVSEERDRLTIELLKVVELKKIASILVENESNKY